MEQVSGGMERRAPRKKGRKTNALISWNFLRVESTSPLGPPMYSSTTDTKGAAGIPRGLSGVRWTTVVEADMVGRGGEGRKEEVLA